MSYDEEDLGNHSLIQANSTNPQSFSIPSDSTPPPYNLPANIATYNQYPWIQIDQPRHLRCYQTHLTTCQQVRLNHRVYNT